MREARVWVNLRHPNVLPFIGLFDIGAPVPILVSQFCEFGHVGEYLTSHVDANRNHLVHNAAAGLKYLHDLDIVHGDLKPENVLIDKRGVACIADFGMFKIMEFFNFSPRPAAVYTAPELSAFLELAQGTIIGHGPEPTKMSDVYSLGLLTVEVCISCDPPPLANAACRRSWRLSGSVTLFWRKSQKRLWRPSFVHVHNTELKRFPLPCRQF
ncbi:kinase-like domain-containing protein [Mycena olivaceomarginata]|nr:kinase-like domain-containing protein [Mycena olivaceomarginata]